MTAIIAANDWFKSNFSFGRLWLSCAVLGVIFAII